MFEKNLTRGWRLSRGWRLLWVEYHESCGEFQFDDIGSEVVGCSLCIDFGQSSGPETEASGRGQPFRVEAAPLPPDLGCD